MRRTHQGRGAASPAALGLLGLLGLFLGTALVVLALIGQVPDPPGPASGTAASTVVTPDMNGHGQGHSRAARDSAAATTEPAPEAGGHGPAANGIPEGRDESGRPGESVGTEQGAASTDGSTTVAPLVASEPVAVRAPAIGVASPLHALGLAEDGTLEVPTGARVDEAAWYSGSPTPGETGPAVIEGHVTSAGGRPSVFFELGALEVGDEVEVDRADGSTVTFEVYRVKRYPKDQFPTVQVYGITAGPELRLITCGGEFDTASGHHLDNTVVYARMAADA